MQEVFKIPTVKLENCTKSTVISLQKIKLGNKYTEGMQHVYWRNTFHVKVLCIFHI